MSSISNPLDAIVSQLKNFGSVSAPHLTPLDTTGVGSGIPNPIEVGSTGFNPVNTNDTGNTFPSTGTSTTYPSSTVGPTGTSGQAVTLGSGISATSSSCAWYDVRCWGLQLIFILLGLICILGAIYLYKPTRDVIGGTWGILKGSKAR